MQMKKLLILPGLVLTILVNTGISSIDNPIVDYRIMAKLSTEEKIV